MLCTLVCTRFAYVSANGTYHSRLAASHAHELGGSVADGRAFHVKLNASRHHSYILFLRAGGSTMVANGGTLKACVYTSFVLMITGHYYSFLCLGELLPKALPVAWQFAFQKTSHKSYRQFLVSFKEVGERNATLLHYCPKWIIGFIYRGRFHGNLIWRDASGLKKQNYCQLMV